ncbi:hypothetical protein [Amycolatopsis orientalis]|uniref:hypothetical protein n=1 Tax=Amycolatopsis orientalis TaxID=31958 RepID=UPI00126929A3|nr:hypothetical protein [Amycolatopsis orientalis]
MTPTPKSRRTAVVTGMIALGALLAAPAEAATAQEVACTWQAKTLPVPAGTVSASVDGTDGRGEFSGQVSDGSVSRIIRWKHGGFTLRDIPAGYERASVNDQNRWGDIVGYAATPGSADYASFVLSGSTYRFLPTLEGHRYPRASAINSRGDVVGVVAHLDPYYEVPVLWPAGGNPVAITNTQNLSNPVDIDDDGTVLFGDGSGGPYTWKDGVLTSYALPAGYDDSSPVAISAGKVIASLSADGRYTGDGFVWDGPRSPRRLERNTGVFAINRSGVIGGQIDTQQIGPPAVWDATGQPTRLPLPDGASGGRVSVVGDDGRIGGTAGWSTPVAWRCAG